MERRIISPLGQRYRTSNISSSAPFTSINKLKQVIPGTSNPALIDTLDTKSSIIGPPLKSDGSRKRALVPGCGKGYDVHLFAAYGYDAYGLEVGYAVEAARRFAPEADTKEEYRARDAGVGKGKVEFVQGDFFAKDWEQGIGGGGFDVIYDYTVCHSPLSLHSNHRANTLVIVPLRHAAQPAVSVVETNGGASCAGGYIDYPRVSDVQGSFDGRTAVWSQARDV
jgi:SAM-dependent methyltransferase